MTVEEIQAAISQFALAIVVGWLVIGGIPGIIALLRGHRQVNAITVCGYFGIFTFGWFWMAAMVWALTMDVEKTIHTKRVVRKPRAVHQESEKALSRL